MFQPPVPVDKVLERIHDRTYVLPAIQREFVWSPQQICTLFDSLMRGYPIGSLLLWRIPPARVHDFRFYDFLNDYDERQPFALEMKISQGKDAIAVLDGQQRLTSLNIGLYGSHTERQPRMWASNPAAYPRKRLYLDLQNDLKAVEDDDLQYRFAFLTDEDARVKGDEPDRWYPVSDILGIPATGRARLAEIERRRLPQDAEDLLDALFEGVCRRPSINVYLEEDEDPDKVLDVFVRVNSAGTQLSYSDLLLSTATNQWRSLNAREEVRALVAQLNEGQFTFDKNVVLKAALVLTDAPNIRFKVSSFTTANTAKMEEQWLGIRSSLLIARDLIKSFGYTFQTLTAANVLIPIAYYIHRRGLDASFLTSAHTANDRAAVRSWVNRSLMKRGIWSSAADTLLTRLRAAIRDIGAQGFPITAIEAAMDDLGKGIQFQDAEIDEVLALEYGNPRTFATLALMYPSLDTTKSLHVDHVFPRAQLTKAKLVKAGLDETSINAALDEVNGLANLQLLAGLPNEEKNDTLPGVWLKGPLFQTDDVRERYINENDLNGIPDDVTGFLAFHHQRSQRMRARLQSVLAASMTGASA